MKPSAIPILVGAAAVMATAASPLAARPEQSAPDRSRAATFVGLKGSDTVFVERVRDAPGGFHGEVSVAKGSVWIRYRVEVGPDESIRRYELDMTPQGEGSKGIPIPLLVTRRTRDSIVVEPEPESGLPPSGQLMPPGAFIGAPQMTVFEQAIRFALHWNPAGVSILMVSAWTGKGLPATVNRKGDTVLIDTGMDSWEFKLDQQNRIVSGMRLESHPPQANDPWRGIRVVRLDPSGPNPINRPLTIGESEEGRRRDLLDSRMQAWARQESTFHATLASQLPPHELTAALDHQIAGFADHGGVYQSDRCLEAAAAFSGEPGKGTLAERYARQAVACADGHDVRSFGEQGMMEARVKTRMALAQLLADGGRRDSAIALLEATRALPRPYDRLSLRRDVLRQLGDVFAADGRTNDAIGSLFDAVALDDTPGDFDEPLRRSLLDLWRRHFPDDTTIAARMGRAHGLNQPMYTGGGSWLVPRGRAAPAWSGRDLRGRRHAWHAGRPLIVVFWGGWSEPGRKMVRLAEQWYVQRERTGVDVVAFDWELPGPGPFSEYLARRAVRAENLTLPVLLDLDRQVWGRFRAEGFPQAFFVDREGRIARTMWGGAWRADGLSAWAEQLGRNELH